eukprot:jgi/Picre1/32154/NNA_007500.t1
MAHAVSQQLARLTVGGNDSVKSYSGFRAMNTVRVPSVVANRGVSSGRGTLQIMAARVGGVEIPNAKPIEYSLQYIYGIGHTTAKAICVDTGIAELYVNLNIKRLKEIGCYRGRRHINGLPTRGQNTKNNARTRKGRAVAIPGKKK